MRLDDLGAARLLLDALDMDVDEALAQRAGGAGCVPLKPVSRPAASRSTVKTGCTTKRTSMPRSAELRQHRIDQERHVVVDDLEHRIAAPRS